MYFCSMFRIYFILALFISNVQYNYGQGDDLRVEIDKIIRYDTDIDFKKTPGFVVSVIDNNATYHFPFGRKNMAEKTPPSANDIFEIGSVTKVFTSELIQILAEESLLHLDDKVNDYLPDEWQNPRLADLTIGDLVYHQSGLPKRPAFFGKKEKDGRNPYAAYNKNDLLAYYRDYIPDRKSFEYSHTNYALLEIIIEKVTDMSYQDVIEEKIFSKLNMTNSFVDFPEKKENLLCPGHDRSKKNTTPWTFASFKGSEGVKSSSEDLTKFVKNILDNHDKNAPTTESFNKKLGIEMGWHAIHMNDFDILTHTGKTTGHNAFVAMVRETKTAVIILANSSIGTEDLGLQILRMINYNWKRIKV